MNGLSITGGSGQAGREIEDRNRDPRDGKVIRKFDKCEAGGEETRDPARPRLEKEKKLEPKEGFEPLRVGHARPETDARAEGGDQRGRQAAPKVAPGTYQVRLTVDGKSFTQPFEVKANPTVGTSPLDLQAVCAAGGDDPGDGLSQTHETVLKIRDLKAQIQSIDEHAKKTGKGEATGPKPRPSMRSRRGRGEADQPGDQVQRGRPELRSEHDPEIAVLAAEVASADTKPTAAEAESITRS